MFTIDTFNPGSPLGEKSGLGLPVSTRFQTCCFSLPAMAWPQMPTFKDRRFNARSQRVLFRRTAWAVIGRSESGPRRCGSAAAGRPRWFAGLWGELGCRYPVPGRERACAGRAEAATGRNWRESTYPREASIPGLAGNILLLHPRRAQQGRSLALAFRRSAFTRWSSSYSGGARSRPDQRLRVDRSPPSGAGRGPGRWEGRSPAHRSDAPGLPALR